MLVCSCGNSYCRMKFHVNVYLDVEPRPGYHIIQCTDARGHCYRILPPGGIKMY